MPGVAWFSSGMAILFRKSKKVPELESHYKRVKDSQTTMNELTENRKRGYPVGCREVFDSMIDKFALPQGTQDTELAWKRRNRP